MVKNRYLNKLLIMVTDVIVIYVSIVLAYYMRTWSGTFTDLVPLNHEFSLYLSKWWFPLIIVGSIGYHRGYGIIISFWDDFLVILKSLFMSFLIVWVVFSMQKEAETVSRIIITVSFALMLVLMPISRGILKFVLYKIIDLREHASIFEKKISSSAGTLKAFLNKEWYSGYKIMDYMESDSSKTKKVDALFLSMEDASDETVKKLKPNAKDLIIVSEMSGLSFMNTEIKTFLDRNVALITTTNGLLLRNKVFLKRVFDLTISALALAALSPLFLIIPLLIKLDSPGPVYFRHKRCGKKMDEFEMVKFRTMRIDGEKVLEEFIQKNPEAIIDLEERNKIEHDPRVTRIGSLLRKTSLDELPQLMDVIRGYMTIVGPRPDTTEAIRKYYQEYSEIYENVRPGITGLWQVSGRSEIDYAKRVKLDYLYMLNWSLWFDIVIILKTFRSILNRKGAY
jgi:exopolysaccharide biosynthesis polyprenyl glycosylphosphotransferase